VRISQLVIDFQSLKGGLFGLRIDCLRQGGTAANLRKNLVAPDYLSGKRIFLCSGDDVCSRLNGWPINKIPGPLMSRDERFNSARHFRVILTDFIQIGRSAGPRQAPTRISL